MKIITVKELLENDNLEIEYDYKQKWEILRDWLDNVELKDISTKHTDVVYTTIKQTIEKMDTMV